MHFWFVWCTDTLKYISLPLKVILKGVCAYMTSVLTGFSFYMGGMGIGG